MKDKKKLIDLKDECFDYFKNNFIAWEKDCFIDPWGKNKNEEFKWKNEEKSPPDAPGIYLFNSKTKFEHPYGKSGIYYIGKASNNLKVRLEPKLNADYQSKYYTNGRYIDRNNGKNLNHYYPYLNYYQKFTTTIWCKIIKKDMVPYVEEILISAFFTKMGNRPPSNRTGPNQSIWTDSENSKKLKTIYCNLLSSKILD